MQKSVIEGLQTFSKYYSSPKNPEIIFELNPVTEDNYADAAELIAHAYSKNSLFARQGLTEDKLYNEILLPIAEKVAEENTGVTCYEVEDCELVGALFQQDLSAIIKDLSLKYKSFLRWSELGLLFKQQEELINNITRNKGYSFLVTGIAVNSNFRGLGLGSEMLNLCMTLHPGFKDAKYFLYHPFGKADLRSGVKAGYQELCKKDWSQLEELDASAKILKEIISQNKSETTPYMSLQFFERNEEIKSH